jgi:hypothetical protein
MNQYIYCVNNPLGYVDPSGNMPNDIDPNNASPYDEIIVIMSFLTTHTANNAIKVNNFINTYGNKIAEFGPDIWDAVTGLFSEATCNVVKSVDDIPTVKSGNFEKWFNSLTPDELDSIWRNKKFRKKIERQLRAPGGMHEWHLVSRAPQFKKWGVSAEKIRNLRTAIDDVNFVNPVGKHGGLGSTKAHNELLEIIDSSSDYDMFKRRLNNWANYRLEGGINSLPEGLRLK